MNLSLLDRYVLLRILPQEGNAATMRAIRTLRESLWPSEDEIVRWNIRQEESNVQWTLPEGDDGTADIPIGPFGLSEIVKALNELNNTNKLTSETLGLYERFCEDAETK